MPVIEISPQWLKTRIDEHDLKFQRIADKAGLSIDTVSRVYNADETVRILARNWIKIQAAVTEMIQNDAVGRRNQALISSDLIIQFLNDYNLYGTELARMAGVEYRTVLRLANAGPGKELYVTHRVKKLLVDAITERRLQDLGD